MVFRIVKRPQIRSAVRVSCDMPLGREKDEDGKFNGPDHRGTKRLLEETRRILDNTRSFLEGIRDGEEASRLYIEEMRRKLENDVRRLERGHLDHDGQPPGLEPEN